MGVDQQGWKELPVDKQPDNHRELPCFTGVIDTKGFLEGLVKIGYDGPVAAEPNHPKLGSIPAEQSVARTAAAMKKAFALVDSH